MTALPVHSRTVTAACFGAVGGGLAALWYGPIVLPSHRPVAWLLFIGTPAIAAALAGAAGGRALLDPARTSTGWAASLRGGGIALLALVFFGPIFAVAYVATEPPTETFNVVGLTILIWTGAFLAAGWLAAVLGAALGWGLYRLARRPGVVAE